MSEKSLSVAYAIQRQNRKAKGGMIESAPAEISGDKCAHGGPVMCNAGCYDLGGEVDDNIDEDGDLEMDELDTYSEGGEVAPVQEMKKGRLLSRILQSSSKRSL